MHEYKFSETFIIAKDQSIDEAMVQFKGCLSMKGKGLSSLSSFLF